MLEGPTDVPSFLPWVEGEALSGRDGVAVSKTSWTKGEAVAHERDLWGTRDLLEATAVLLL